MSISDLELQQIKRWGSLLPRLFSCLPQALAVKLWDGGSKIHFGIQNTGAFEAHAWVEKNDEILIGHSPNDNFKPIWVW